MSGGWKVSKDALEASLNILFSVPARHGMETSEYLKIEKHKDNSAKLSLSSEMSGCSYLIGDKGCPLTEPIYLDRRMLSPFVSEGKDLAPGYYKLKIHDGFAVLRHGRREGKYKSNKKAHGYLKSPSFSSASHLISEELGAILACARHVAVDDPVAPHLSCVYIKADGDSLKILSANAHQFFSSKIKIPKGFKLRDVAMPLPLIDAVATENSVELLYSDKVAMLKFSSGVLWHPVKSEARKKFPYKIVDSMVKNGMKGDTLLTVDSNALHDCASRASSYMSSLSAEEVVLKLECQKGDPKVKIKCNTVGADFVEYIKIREVSKGDVAIEWPLRAILPILNYCAKSGEAKISHDDKGRTCFSAGSVAMLIARPEKKKGKSHGSERKSKSKD